MSAERNSLTARVARWALACAVRYWPEENRAWGLALAAEVDEAASTFETVRWSLGGIMFFTRSVASSAWAWMKLPAGSSLPGGSKAPDGAAFMPKRSRIFTAVVVAAAAGLLILPEGREAIRTVRSSWVQFQQTGADTRKLEEIAARAEKEKDAATLAFVGLSAEDAKRSSKWLEKAVALDPKYVWTYAAAERSLNTAAPRKDWAAQLQATEPENAVPYLLEADALVAPRVQEIIQHGAPAGAEEKALAEDAKWVALMERAFIAERYDSYFQKHAELTRAIWNRESDLSPAIAVSGLWRHAVPNLFHVGVFSKLKIAEAQRARAARDVDGAAKVLTEVETFGGRMADSSGSKIERMIALSLMKNAEREMIVLYSNAGRSQDAANVTAALAKTEARVDGMRWDIPGAFERHYRFQRYANVVQISAIAGVVAGLSALIGILFLEFRVGARGIRPSLFRKACFWAADFAPACFLAACGTFLLAYLPYQFLLAEYRASNFQMRDQEKVMDAIWGLLAFPQGLLGVNAAVAFWMILTVSLTALLLFLIARWLYRMKRPAQISA